MNWGVQGFSQSKLPASGHFSFSDHCSGPRKMASPALWGREPRDGCLDLWGPTWEWEDVGRCWRPEAAAAQSVWGRQWALCAGHGWGTGGQSDTLAGMCQACLEMPAHYSPDWLPCGTLPHLADQVLRTLWVKGQSLDHQKGTWGWRGCGRPAKVLPSLSHVSGGIMWTGIRSGVSPPG